MHDVGRTKVLRDGPAPLTLVSLGRKKSRLVTLVKAKRELTVTDNQWNPERAGPASRWVLRHVWSAPGGVYRLVAFTCFLCVAVLAAITWWVHADPNALESDRDFFPFITAFFGIIGLFFVGLSLISWLRSRRAALKPRGK